MEGVGENATNALFVRKANTEPVKMLRNCFKVRFGEATARRCKVRSMSGNGMYRLLHPAG